VFKVPAEAYDRWVGRYSPALARELTEFAGVTRGERALDVGCGPGALTTQLATISGAQNVAAVDPSESFVAACRERNPRVRVELAGAASMPFQDGEFDHALAQLVVNFMPDAHAGLAEMRRVTGSGGAITACTWDYADGMTLIRNFFDAAIALEPSAAEHDEGTKMRYCQPDELQALWVESGLNDVEVRPLVVIGEYAGFEDLWSPLEYGVGPAGAYVVSLDAERRSALKDELRRRLGVADQPFELTARAWAVRGVAP
jgi:ubiquinone/menaquinone biosynthesis C-methylase UbiE